MCIIFNKHVRRQTHFSRVYCSIRPQDGGIQPLQNDINESFQKHMYYFILIALFNEYVAIGLKTISFPINNIHTLNK